MVRQNGVLNMEITIIKDKFDAASSICFREANPLIDKIKDLSTKCYQELISIAKMHGHLDNNTLSKSGSIIYVRSRMASLVKFVRSLLNQMNGSGQEIVLFCEQIEKINAGLGKLYTDKSLPDKASIHAYFGVYESIIGNISASFAKILEQQGLPHTKEDNPLLIYFHHLNEFVASVKDNIFLNDDTQDSRIFYCA